MNKLEQKIKSKNKNRNDNTKKGGYMIEENKSSMKNSVRRLIIAGIGVLIQIIWVVVLVMRLNQYSQIITLLTVAIELVLVLAVYSMDTNAAFKLPWIILITVAPIVGICVSFYLADQGNKKVRARYRKIDQQLFAYLNQDEQIIEELSKRMSGLQMTLNICGNVHQVLFTKIQM